MIVLDNKPKMRTFAFHLKYEKKNVKKLNEFRGEVLLSEVESHVGGVELGEESENDFLLLDAVLDRLRPLRTINR